MYIIKSNMNINNEEIEKNMKIYANKYKMDNVNDSKYKKIKNPEDIANMINRNFHSLDYVEKINIIKNIYTETNINKKLFKFELSYLNIGQKYENLEDLTNIVEQLLNRYHSMIGNQLLEDDKWNLHKMGSTKYELVENEAIFDNSLKFGNNVKAHKYIKKLIKLFSKLTNDYKITYKYIPDNEEGMTWVIIKIAKM